MAQTRIGFIGLGMMGAPMARRLGQAGHALALDDADPERTRALCGELRADPLTHERARQLDVVITMLPNSAVVEEVLLGKGLADALPAGATVIDMSSSEPVRSRELGETLAAKGLGYLDAPVSGGVKRAVDGSLAILVGGEAALLARHRPVLEAMGRSVLHIGAAGAGHAAKALNNFVSAAGLIATVEALHVARRFGIDPEVMTDVLNASTGRSNTSENKVKPFMLSGSYASGFSLKLMDKDLGIAGALAQSVGYPLAFGRHGIALWHAVAQEAGPTSDHTEMYRFLADEE
ncbi:NAD(P)-dependent oxidoreductase [Methylobacterium sp. J-076]|uniref:NAD(P)-dependent oxidoreductase n=1 Tax=Methylobacterium sp. J-076 TaxID=2836655 RepID=UPI001FBA913B|nr:NAD(P)-dependent oxidoreductase [Methylobacterium sp. J-076]MCJ2013554.1 NAD(P)-dependent oxidoreductase [Methylobacterium sp. J-076]